MQYKQLLQFKVKSQYYIKHVIFIKVGTQKLEACNFVRKGMAKIFRKTFSEMLFKKCYLFLCVLLIAQLIINLSSPGKIFNAQLIIQCAKLFFRFVKSWICVFFSLKLVKKDSNKSVLIPPITILLKTPNHTNLTLFCCNLLESLKISQDF